MVQSIILTGPTAVGKSSLAVDLAEALGLEIINADSVCFYEEFNIGSAKPSIEDLKRVPHHLINIASPHEIYHAGKFLKDCDRALSDIHARGKRALIVGGSGFYLKALRMGLWEAPATSPAFRKEVETVSTEELFEELSLIDPTHALKVGSEDRYRLVRGLEIYRLSGKKPSELEAMMPDHPKPEFSLWVVDREKTELDRRMHSRVEQMIEAGLVNETQRLREKYPEAKTLNAVGYAQVIQFMEGTVPPGRKLKRGINGLIDEIELAHRQLAKQQRTWFKNLKANESFTLDQDLNDLKEKLMNFYQ
ncbi:MAG: tRNA (adenosine(37)-N6)-dimethylallyltransferase MiaA [Bdellovibrionales bacterium]|nr:tRNA (adenosine(37)-N6)-dimethylallyltransferase MiaA [Oligoflexia bacterium]